jgi:hypothetical protein
MHHVPRRSIDRPAGCGKTPTCGAALDRAIGRPSPETATKKALSASQRPGLRNFLRCLRQRPRASPRRPHARRSACLPDRFTATTRHDAPRVNAADAPPADRMSRSPPALQKAVRESRPC